MKKLSLVCTVHQKSGAATVAELLFILEHLQPEVIFLEMHSDDFDSFHISCARKNLESEAIILYQKNHKVDLVPVDLPDLYEQVCKDYETLIPQIEKKSNTFCMLMDHYKNYLIDYGVRYFHTDDYNRHLAERNEAILTALEELSDPKLDEINRAWLNAHDLREIEMLKNIYDYCGRYSFERGAFMLGAAHRLSIIEKTKVLPTLKQTEIEWDFYLNPSRHQRA